MADIDYTRSHPALAPFTLTRRGCVLHCWEAGPETAEVVIMHHGATADHRMFNAQVGPLLESGYRVIAVDGRGHGASRPMATTPSIDDYADDFLAVLDERNVETAVFLGQSLGAYVAQHAINRRPQRCRALVVVGSTLISMPLSRTDAAALRASILAFRVWPWAHLAHLTATSTARSVAGRDYMTECLEALGKQDYLRIWRAVNSSVSTTGFPALPASLPILWTHGELDRAGNIVRDIPRILGQPLPRLEYHVMAGASHNANQDNPLDFNAVLLTFLSRLSEE